jgi:mutual gliding-motility protein MglA
MATINYALREISVKIVYYGTGLCGKTTNLQVIHRKVPTEFKSDMVSLATETDRTLFFDFLPLDLGKIKGFSTKFQLYTVPGQVYYNATRKLVLRGVDGVVFVVDSAPEKVQENIESFKNLEENLAEYGYQRENIPIIMQYNKRDFPNAVPIDKLNALVNKYGLPWNESIAVQGKGVFESLKMMGKLVIDNLNKKYSRSSSPAAPPSPQPVAPSQADPYAPQPQGRPDGFQQRPAPAPLQRQQPPPVRPSPAQPAAWPPRQPQQAAPQPIDDPFREIPAPQPAGRPRPQAAPQFTTQPSPPPQQPKSNPDYYDYGSINLEPIARPAQPVRGDAPQPPAGNPPEASSSIDKTDLDLEIERYQREIEEKQRKQRPGQQSPNQPQSPQAGGAASRSVDFDVYESNAPADDQARGDQSVEPENEQAAQAGGQPLYFTSVNTDRQRKKVKRPINPKTKPQGGFLSKLFNKDNP